MAKTKAKTKTAKTSKPKVDRGEASYVVQARKLKALIDTLKDQSGPATEVAVLKELARRGFPVHPRTLARARLRRDPRALRGGNRLRHQGQCGGGRGRGEPGRGAQGTPQGGVVHPREAGRLGDQGHQGLTGPGPAAIAPALLSRGEVFLHLGTPWPNASSFFPPST